MKKIIKEKWGEEKSYSEKEFELYWQYKNELWKIEGMHPYSKEAVDSWYKEYLDDAGCCIRIFNENKEQIGFVFVGTYPNCHEDADFYIQDCFIMPEYRKRSVMSAIVSEFIADNPGDYCLYLIDQNAQAQNFWRKMFGSLGYEEFQIKDYTDMETDSCHLHGFTKKVERK